MDTPLLRFLAPTALEVAGSDLHRACLTRLCCAFRLPRPPDASFPPLPCRSCFIPAALLGFALQRVSLPIRRNASRHPLPLLALLSTVARGVRPSPLRLRVAARRRSPLRGAVAAPSARTWPVSGAPSGVSARIGSPYSGRRAVSPHDGSRSSPGISALQGFPPPRLDAADAASPLVRFVSACRNRPGTGASGSRSARRSACLSRGCRPSWASCPRPGSRSVNAVMARAATARGWAGFRTRCAFSRDTRGDPTIGIGRPQPAVFKNLVPTTDRPGFRDDARGAARPTTFCPQRSPQADETGARVASAAEPPVPGTGWLPLAAGRQ